MTFSGSALDYDDWTIDFGDGDAASGSGSIDATHTYGVGSFRAVLTVSSASRLGQPGRTDHRRRAVTRCRRAWRHSHVSIWITSPKARQVVWSRAWTTNASRTIKLVLVGNGRVDIDAIVILRDPV